MLIARVGAPLRNVDSLCWSAVEECFGCNSWSKTDDGLLVRVIPMLSYMIEDLNSSVVKRVMTAFMQLYMMAFVYTVKSKSSPEDIKEMWKALHETKLRAVDMLEAENDGIRTMAIKFIEIVILAQTTKEPV
ncbi:Symplekin [Geodia barretti]|uniref:Symplekin n=1 Tax=Geodia barretti TaxID=519541 RepID=A0AA35TDC6_GEOBA|nr:Symplekin [Geodia barretti]